MNLHTVKKHLVLEACQDQWLVASNYNLKYTKLLAEKDLETIHGVRTARIFVSEGNAPDEYILTSSFVIHDRDILDGFSTSFVVPEDNHEALLEAEDVLMRHRGMIMHVIDGQFPRKLFLEEPLNYQYVNVPLVRFEVTSMTLRDVEFYASKIKALDAMIDNGLTAPEEKDFYTTSLLATSNKGPYGTTMSISLFRPTYEESNSDVVGYLCGGHRYSDSFRPEGGGMPVSRRMSAEQIAEKAVGYFSDAEVPFGFPVDDVFHVKKLHILKAMENEGWTPFSALSIYATNGLGYKMNSTIAAENEAQLMFTAVKDHENRPGVVGIVSGQYTTEGKNAAVNMWLEIREDQGSQEIVEKTTGFIRQIQNAIDKTTFRKLHLERSESSTPNM